MAFKKRGPESTVPPDPEQLYRLLSRGSGAPAGLWVHQAEILRSWHGRFQSAKDVAVELPTGAGKTLVGGLLGEFRRRAQGERIVYVCPTRQLARQTSAKLKMYGIPSVLLIGKARGFNPATKARYTSGLAVAVTVYSHIFNSNSAFSDAQFMILDDAHAAEGPVANAWSIEIKRESAAYRDVLSVLSDAMDPIVLSRLRTDTLDGQYRPSVYLASPLGIVAAADQLEQTLDAAVAAGTLGNDVKYSLRMMSGHLARCLVYLSYGSILVRPLIAPTATLQAFSGPSQRLYMSATLGSGGELERSFGRNRIDRIPVPTGWDKQGTGRRFFCFPELTADLSEHSTAADPWVQATISEAGRAVVLTPDSWTAKDFAERRLPPGIRQFGAEDVEDDLSAFTNQASASLVLTNRYDGVDLPDNDCRLVIMHGLPAKGDLQERFLYGSLGALEVLQERIRARIAQGAGRATRNSGDWATVVLLGDDLTAFCTRNDVREALHPELHAEIDFGLNNSLATTSAEMTDNIRIFNEQGEEWRDVDADIIAARDQFARAEPAGTTQLAAAAASEVAASLSSWQGELDRALEMAKAAIDALRGGRGPQRYAALWNYLAACWSYLLAERQDSDALRAASASYYKAARAAGRGTTWLSHLAAPADLAVQDSAAEQRDPLDTLAASNVLRALSTVGKPNRFDQESVSARSALVAKEAKPYEEALVYMGTLAGASTSDGNGGATAAPDAAWLFGGITWIAWEAKSDAAETGELGAGDVRQAGSHLRYVCNYRDESIPSGSIVPLVTPHERVHSAARAIAEGHVYLVSPETVLTIYDRLVRAWRTLRARGADLTLQDVLDIMHREEALPTQWLSLLSADPLSRSGTS